MNANAREIVRLLGAKRDALLQEPANGAWGLDWCERHSRLCDEVVRVIAESVGEELGEMPEMAIVATGGYGRQEMAPYSDIDMSVIPAHEGDPRLDAYVKALFRDIHEAFATFGLEVGYAFRLLADAPGLDAKSRTGLLDARRVAGSPKPLDELLDAVWETMPAGDFLLAKIRERESAFAKYHDTPLVVEHQLKEGAGGMRCFHCANWIRAAIGERPATPTRAFEQIARMRNHLHVVVGRRQDAFTRQRQAEIADRLGLDLYEMMAGVADAASHLHREYGRAVDAVRSSRFDVSRGVVALRGEVRVSGDASLSEAAEGIALATQLGLDVLDLPTATSNEVNGAAAFHAVCSGEAVVRNLERCGLLARLLPELAKCRTLMPRDSSHAFTVFEHTLRVVRALEGLRPGSFLGDLMDGLHEPLPLFLAALLHDVGKLDLSGAHSDTGERIARDVCTRWDLSEDATEMIVWLVKEHLEMSRILRMRDVQNPQTAHDFALHVGDIERLDMLTLLTWADTLSVGEGVWTPAQEHLMEVLHSRTSQVLLGDAPAAPDPALYRKRLMRELKQEAFDDDEVKAFVDSLPAHYLISTPPDVVRLHIGFAHKAQDGETTVVLHPEPELGTTEMTVCAQDASGLLGRVLGVLYAYDVRLHGIRASTTRTKVPIAVDQFSTSFGDRPIPPGTGREVVASIKKVMSGELDVGELLRARGKDPEGAQRSYTFTFLEGTPGILEVRAPRGKGMAYRFSRLISLAGWNIQAARVGQWAGRGAAAFYITGPGERALSSQEVEAVLGPQV